MQFVAASHYLKIEQAMAAVGRVLLVASFVLTTQFSLLQALAAGRATRFAGRRDLYEGHEGLADQDCPRSEDPYFCTNVGEVYRDVDCEGDGNLDSMCMGVNGYFMPGSRRSTECCLNEGPIPFTSCRAFECQTLKGYTLAVDQDRMGDDLYDQPYGMDDAFLACNANMNCSGFNNRGWTKITAAPLEHSPGSCFYTKLSVLPECPTFDGYIASFNEDHIGDNITKCYQRSWGTYREAARDCNNNPKCKGFNSDGWTKSVVRPTQRVNGSCLYTKGCPPVSGYIGIPNYDLDGDEIKNAGSLRAAIAACNLNYTCKGVTENGSLKTAATLKPKSGLCSYIKEALPNLARGATAYGSSNVLHFEPMWAIDGVTNPDMSSYTDKMYRSRAEDRDKWLSIDLGYPAIISEVILYNRRDCCGERLQWAEIYAGDFNVTTRNRLIWQQPPGPGATGAVYRINVWPQVTARWVILQESWRVVEPLNILELEVYGRPLIPEGLSNLALGAAAYGSAAESRPELAVDGITTPSTNEMTGIKDKMFYLGPSDKQWLSVDLGLSATISQLVLYNRHDCCGQWLVGAEIRIGAVSITNSSTDSVRITRNARVWKQQRAATTGGVYVISLPQPAVGRWISLQNFNPKMPMGIVELEVYGKA